MGVFSKTNSSEYNNELEEILETKPFDISVKNLLLSTLYKIEAAYNDYKTVKVNADSKEEFIQKILYIIKEECSKIKIVTPQTPESKPLEDEKLICKIDPDRGFILVYANETDLLYALMKMYVMQKFTTENDKGEQSYYKLAIQEFILNAKAINGIEPIRDFDGWSWNNNFKNPEDIEYNLIYQDLLMTDTNLEDEKSFIENFEQAVINPYTFEKNIYTIILAMVAEKNRDIKEKIQEECQKRLETIELMNSKTTFLNKVTEEKKKITKEIKEIDEKLNDKEKLKREYIKRNEKLSNNEKIFSLRYLVQILKKERDKKLEELRQRNKLLEPMEFVKQKNMLENEHKMLEDVLKMLKNKEFKKQTLIDTQAELIQSFKKQVEDIHDKDLLDLAILKFRYYCLLQMPDGKIIGDNPKLEPLIEETINTIIDNSIDAGLITNFSNSISACYSILKHVFTTKIIDLKEVSIKIEKIRDEKNKIKIVLYDGQEEEETYIEEIKDLSLLNVKLNKKIILFNKKAIG